MQQLVKELYQDLIKVQEISDSLQTPEAVKAIERLEWVLADTIMVLESS